MSPESSPASTGSAGGGTAFVLGGGGVLGAAEVGMLRAVAERGIQPDVVMGSSVGALNGALFAAEPTPAGVRRLERAWTNLQPQTVFGGSLMGRVSTLVRHGTHVHSNESLRALIDEALPGARIEDLAVRFECVAASIERAGAHWFDRGSLADAVLASCAVPGLLPPVEVDGEHFLDGGLVHSVPVGRAIAQGVQRVFVLQVGRLERPLVAPRLPWELGLVVFENRAPASLQRGHGRGAARCGGPRAARRRRRAPGQPQVPPGRRHPRPDRRRVRGHGAIPDPTGRSVMRRS